MYYITNLADDQEREAGKYWQSVHIKSDRYPMSNIYIVEWNKNAVIAKAPIG